MRDNKWIYLRVVEIVSVLSEGLQCDMVDFRCPLHAVPMATCVTANLRHPKTKSLSLAESGRGVNHCLHTHANTRGATRRHLGPTKVSGWAWDGSRQKTSDSKAWVHYCSTLQKAHTFFAPFTDFVCQVSHRMKNIFHSSYKDWQWLAVEDEPDAEYWDFGKWYESGCCAALWHWHEWQHVLLWNA